MTNMIKNELQDICSFCSQLSDCKPLEGLAKEMLEIVAPQGDVITKANNYICPKCSESLRSAFEFKSICLENEDELQNYVSPSQDKIDLQTVIGYTSIAGSGDLPDNYAVCRICFKIVQKYDEFYRCLDHVDLLKECVPDMNLDYTNDPVLCSSCYKSTVRLFTFIRSWIPHKEAREDYLSRTQNAVINRPMESNPQCTLTTEITLEDIKNEDVHDEIKNTDGLRTCDKKHNIKEEVTEMPTSENYQQTCDTITDNECEKTYQTHSNVFVPFVTNIITSRIPIETYAVLIPNVVKTLPKLLPKPSPSVEKQNVSNSEPIEMTIEIKEPVRETKRRRTPPKSKAVLPTLGCNKCIFTTCYAWALEAHKSEHKGDDIPDLKFNLSSRCKTYICSACNFRDDKRKNLANHLVKMHSKGHTCTICEHKKYYGKIELHMIQEHCKTSINVHKCESCEFSTYSAKEFCKHKQENHRFDCPYCTFHSVIKQSLNRHVEHRHGVYGQFKCDMCPCSFRRKHFLFKHKLQKHSNSKSGQVVDT